jgi:formate/nitrite transporter FocA (FNT family)
MSVSNIPKSSSLTGKKKLDEKPLPIKSDKPKEVDEILNEQIEAGQKEYGRSNIGLFISSVAGGLEIGFSLLLMGVLLTLFQGQVSASSLKFMMAVSYPLGFIFVIIGRSELFTEHTALAMVPVLNGKQTVRSLLILWGLVYFGNVLGGFGFALFITYLAPEIGFIKVSAFEYIANHLLDYPSDTIFFSAILAGWLMGLLGWLVTSSQETISRIFVIILVTVVIALGGLHHCIIGSIEVISGVITSDELTFGDYIRFQWWATIGNLVGGAVFVALLKYSHVKN